MLIGSAFCPLFGVVLVDYFGLKKGNYVAADLFQRGRYWYWRGVNPRAVIALVPTAGAALLMAFVPAFHVVSNYSWFIGAGLGAVVYLVVADRRGPFVDVSGEPIAVPSTH